MFRHDRDTPGPGADRGDAFDVGDAPEEVGPFAHKNDGGPYAQSTGPRAELFDADPDGEGGAAVGDPEFHAPVSYPRKP